MNREIEFRVWDTNEKVMLNEDNWYDIVTKNDKAYFDDECYPYYFLLTQLFELDVHQEKDRFIVMQYTGLTDKNGKKIFEGDIVNFYDGLMEMEMVYNAIVKWHQKSVSFILENKSGIYNFDEFTKDIEVIGTIFDRKES